ncbi:neprilysin [Aplysia californica]|uniref:Neprilysin n=1 Tax=Aplysia californica TaxID=6500 RepID=A0ABM1A971_APLCA|nr:neprilysin [Aplysia californica]
MDIRTSNEKEAWLKEKPKENGSGEQPNVRFKKGFWGGRTSLEKALIVLAVLLLIALITVVVVVVVDKNKEDETSHAAGHKSDGEVCLTTECVSAAARIHSYIDWTVQPCDDLYQFACGRWMREKVIPEDKSSLSTFGILRDEVEIVLKNLLEEEHKPTDLECTKKAKDLYKSCLNTDLINEKGDTALKELIVNELGGWPLITLGWDPMTFDLVNAIITHNKYNSYPLLSVYTGIDNKNSSQRILKMEQTDFGLPGQKYYLVARDDPMLIAYEDLIVGVAKLMGGETNEQVLREGAKEIVDFEIVLANISVPDEERRDANTLYNPMTLRDVHGNYSQAFDWRSYVFRVMTMPDIGITDISDDEVIINLSPPYYKRLTQVLQGTDRRTLANYVVWRFALQLLSTQGEPYQELIRVYRKAIYGISSEMARFRKCAAYTTSYVGLAVGRMFIKDNFDAEAKHMALEMIEGLQHSFNELVDDLDWMDKETKRVARIKNERIAPKIGYPEEITNNTYLEIYYSNYTYTPDDYFGNVLENRREGFKTTMRRLREPYDKEKWESPPSTVNAFYSSIRNQIMFPAGILQPPFFSQTYPKSLNYGGIGVVIGHEITHGFDDRGRQYDSDGNLVQWWSESAIEKFKGKAQCIVDQYGNFTVPEVDQNLNGVNTQGENIADNGGLKQAYRAYRNWVTEQGKEELPLPGLKFSHNQLFFINFAQLWCNLLREENALNRIRTGVHSPGRFRVIGSAQNSEDFNRAFDCPKNSYMNPENKCAVW